MRAAHGARLVAVDEQFDARGLRPVGAHEDALRRRGVRAENRMRVGMNKSQEPRQLPRRHARVVSL
jgi:hypothetical protein